MTAGKLMSAIKMWIMVENYKWLVTIDFRIMLTCFGETREKSENGSEWGDHIWYVQNLDLSDIHWKINN